MPKMSSPVARKQVLQTPEANAVQEPIHEDGAACSSERGQESADADGRGIAAREGGDVERGRADAVE